VSCWQNNRAAGCAACRLLQAAERTHDLIDLRAELGEVVRATHVNGADVACAPAQAPKGHENHDYGRHPRSAGSLASRSLPPGSRPCPGWKGCAVQAHAHARSATAMDTYGHAAA